MCVELLMCQYAHTIKYDGKVVQRAFCIYNMFLQIFIENIQRGEKNFLFFNMKITRINWEVKEKLKNVLFIFVTWQKFYKFFEHFYA